LRRLAVDLAQRALAQGNTPLPVLAPLGDWIGDEPLIEFLARHCTGIGWAIEVLAAQGKLILLLDGFNEMPTAKRRVKASEIKATCNKFKKRHALNAIFTSCRREDYVGDLDLGLETLTLEPLSPQRIQKALQQWVGLANEPPALASRIFWQLAGDERLEDVYSKRLEIRLDGTLLAACRAPCLGDLGEIGLARLCPLERSPFESPQFAETRLQPIHSRHAIQRVAAPPPVTAKPSRPLPEIRGHIAHPRAAIRHGRRRPVTKRAGGTGLANAARTNRQS